MSLPTTGEQFSQLIEHLRKAQENACMIAHLTRDEDKLHAQGWLGVSELLRRTQIQITKLATRRMQ